MPWEAWSVTEARLMLRITPAGAFLAAAAVLPAGPWKPRGRALLRLLPMAMMVKLSICISTHPQAAGAFDVPCAACMRSDVMACGI